MNMKTFKKIGTSLICALFAMPLMAQQTYEEMEQLTVNEQVTTVITASELSASLTSVPTWWLVTSPSTTLFA